MFLLVADGNGDEFKEGVQVIDIGKSNSRLGNFVNGYSRILRKVRKLNPKIVHFHDPELMFVGRRIDKMGTPVIFDIHENIAVQILNKSYIPKVFRRTTSFLYRRIENWLISKFHLIIAEHSYLPVYEAKGKSLTTVLNMPDLSHFKPFVKTERGGNQIFYIGVVSLDRAVETTLEALRILHRRKVDFYMHFIGPINVKVDLEQWSDISDKVKFYGRMDSKEGFELSKNCVLGLSVLKPIKNYIGSYSTKIFEYMAVGLPVITSNFPLYREVVERYDTGYCVDPFSAIDIAEKIEALITNPAQAKEKGMNGLRAVSEKFSWSAEREKMEKLYENLLTDPACKQ